MSTEENIDYKRAWERLLKETRDVMESVNQAGLPRETAALSDMLQRAEKIEQQESKRAIE